MSPGLGEIEAARRSVHTSAPAPAVAVAPPAAVGDEAGSGSPLPTTRALPRPGLRGQLCAVARHVGLRHAADVTADERGVVLHFAPGSHVSLGLDATLGDVSVYAADEARPDWLRLAACAADLHQVARDVLGHHRTLEAREHAEAKPS